MSGGVPRALRLELGRERLCPKCLGRGGTTVAGGAPGRPPIIVVDACSRCAGRGLIDARTGRAPDALPF